MEVGSSKQEHICELSSHGRFLGVGGSGAHLAYTLEYQAAGGMMGEFVAGGNPAGMVKVKRTAEAVKVIAER